MNNTSSNSITNNIIVSKKRKPKNIDKEDNDIDNISGDSYISLNGRLLFLFGLTCVLTYCVKKLY